MENMSPIEENISIPKWAAQIRKMKTHELHLLIKAEEKNLNTIEDNIKMVSDTFNLNHQKNLSMWRIKDLRRKLAILLLK
jgi:uncharacterized protein involved in tolerance to divalent cations